MHPTTEIYPPLATIQGYKIGNLQYFPDDGCLACGKQKVTLKPLLNKLLLHFVSSAGVVHSVMELKQQVWEQEYLTDSAVKKAISELRQQLRKASELDNDFIKNLPGQGYRFEPIPLPLTTLSLIKFPHSSRWWLLIIISLSLGMLIYWYAIYNEDIADQPLSVQAHTLYLQGKALYYKNGDDALVEERYIESIAIHFKANPAHGALLDLWGLQLRSMKHKHRPATLQKKVREHINNALGHPDNLTPDNKVALAKYYLVNEGDKHRALQLFSDGPQRYESVYDPHILAFTLALNGNRAQSQRIMQAAERRFPDRNVILWYKAFVSLLNKQYTKAREESLWAQKLAPDWYPLVFIASHLKQKDEENAWQHLVNFRPAFLNSDLSSFSGFAQWLQLLQAVPADAEYQPFEVEIIYLVARHFNHSILEESAEQWVVEHYPEKQMMLALINELFPAEDQSAIK